MRFAAGFGGHNICVDEQHDLVVVLRWIPDSAGVVERVLGALERRSIWSVRSVH